MELWKYISRRLIQIILVFFLILTVLFVIFRLAPGDPISRMIDSEDMADEDAARLISELGLDQPLPVQYLYYVKNFFSGNS